MYKNGAFALAAKRSMRGAFQGARSALLLLQIGNTRVTMGSAGDATGPPTGQVRSSVQGRRTQLAACSFIFHIYCE